MAGNSEQQSSNITVGEPEPAYTVLVVTEDNEIEGGAGYDSAAEAGKAVEVLGKTFALDGERHLEVRYGR